MPVIDGERRPGSGSGQRLMAAVTLLIILLAVVVASPAAAAQAVLTAARANADGPNARVEITVSSRVPYRVFALPDPSRVVIDLDDVRPGIRAAQGTTAAGPIAAVRIGRLNPGTTRVVIDLARPARIAGTRLSGVPGGQAHVLTVDLAGRPGAVATRPVPRDGRLPAETAVGAVGRASAGGPVAAGPLGRDGSGTATPDRGRGRPPVVVIDPGHGGIDPGAISQGGLYEKHVTLAMAREIRNELAALGSYRIILTRSRDVFIPLRGRVAIARRAGADLLLSIHADKLENRSVRGLSVYTLSERASDAEAAALAERENKADLLADVDLRGAAPDVTNILIDLVQRDTKNQSAKLAGTLVSQMRGEVALLSRTHRFAGFAVLKAPDVPSVLIEVGFLSNAEDEALLRSASGRRKIARGIARGVDGYFTSVEVANRR
jgi:N-acetylmuramoyl-L-alanine amidase